MSESKFPAGWDAGRVKRLTRPGQTTIVIGDAIKAGKSKQAISSAFEAALLSKTD